MRFDMQNVILSALISRSNFADLTASATAAAADGSTYGTDSASDSSGDLRTGSGFDALLASMTAMQQSLSSYSAADTQSGTTGLTAADDGGIIRERDSRGQHADSRSTAEHDDRGEDQDVEQARSDTAAEHAQPLQPWEVTRQAAVRQTPVPASDAVPGSEAEPRNTAGTAQPSGSVPLPDGEGPDLDPQQLRQLSAALQQGGQKYAAEESVLFAGRTALTQPAGTQPGGGMDALMQVYAGRQATAAQTAQNGPAAVMTTADLDNLARELNVTSVSMKYLEPQDSADSRSLENTLDLIRQSRAQLTEGTQSYSEVAREQFLQRSSREALSASAEQGTGRERITIDAQARTAAGGRAGEGTGADPAVAKLSEAGAVRTAGTASQGGQFMGQGQGQSLGQGQGNGSLASMMAAQEQMLNQGIRTGRAQSQSFMQFSRTDAQHNADEIHERVMEMSARNLRELSIDLEPGDLGRMQINISLDSHNDALSVSLAAASPVTRELLEQTQGSLRSLLQQDHIELDTRVYSLGYEDGGSAYGDDPGQGQGGWQQQGGAASDQVLFADAAAAETDETGTEDEAVPEMGTIPAGPLYEADEAGGGVSVLA